MIIPDNEIIIYRGTNCVNKGCFYMQGFIISLVPSGFIASLYLLLNAFNAIYYFIFVFIFYILLSLFTSNRTYKEYVRFFGNDEVAFSNTKIYFNICMNVNGNNQNIDSNRYLNEISEVYIKKFWNPSRLVVVFNDGSHITIHSLANIEKVASFCNMKN